eukprot:TRINITY_DN19022_c0_g1_i1.p1 TRINITY_DN19022_c0_g1~~TRINITY_DN19022_c0_g1_i1.p1  ORF type:complete len:286 (+),score=50.98 TRINITY_DN19022_c0_g1_i1:61-918(+)
MPMRIENPEAARFRAQSGELWRMPQTGGGVNYSNPPSYQHATLPTMVKEGTFKPTADIIKAGKPLFYSRFPGSHLFTKPGNGGASESPCNLSLLDTLSVQREWCVQDHQEVMRWTVGKRFTIRHKKFDRTNLRSSEVANGVSKVENACDRDREFLRFPVSTSAEDQRLQEVREELDREVVSIMHSSTSGNKTGDVRNTPLGVTQSTSSPIPLHAPNRAMSATVAGSRSFQTPGLLNPDHRNSGFNVPNSGLPFICFGKDKFSKPKHRRPLPEVGFNKYGPVKPPE